MFKTTYTWNSLFGFYLEETDLDPYGELNLTDEERDDMNAVARQAYRDLAERLLAHSFPEADATIDAIDEIIMNAGFEVDVTSAEWEDLVDAVRVGPDLDEILNHYIALSEANDEADLDNEDVREENEAVLDAIQDPAGQRKPFASLITDIEFRYLASLHPERALHKSGEITERPSIDVRLSFIARVSAELFEQAFHEYLELADDEKGQRKAIAAAFLDAHAQAHTRFQAEQEAIRTGQAMTAPVLRGLQHGLGLSDEELASALNVGERTVRHWKSGARPIPAGVADEVWALWDDFLDRAYELLEGQDEEAMPRLDPDTPAPVMAAAAILNGRVTIEPRRVTLFRGE